MKATFTAEGRKKNCIIKLEEIEKISSVHRGENEDNAHFIKNPHIFTYLHRQLSAINKSTHSLEKVVYKKNHISVDSLIWVFWMSARKESIVSGIACSPFSYLE